MSGGESKLQGLLAEFDEPETVLLAAKRTRDEGYRLMEAYTPFPVDGLAEAVGMEGDDGVAGIALFGGVMGGMFGYMLQYFTIGVNYPLNVGGRPLNSIPAFIPITYELTILWASLFSFFGVFILCRLPRLSRPVFGVERFKRVSRDGFFLWVGSKDEKFSRDGTKRFLESVGARGVYEVDVEE